MCGLAALFCPPDAAAAPAAAEVEEGAALSVGIYLASDYVYRGISQSQRNAVWQADLEYGAPTGGYVGAFASRVDYTPAGIPDDGVTTELSYRAGWRLALPRSVSVDASLQRVTYPGADEGDLYDYFEASVALGIGDHIALRTMYAPDYFGFDGAVRDHGVDFTWDRDTYGAAASVGYFDQSQLSGEGYGYLEASVWRMAGRLRLEAGWSRTFSYSEALEEVNGAAYLARPHARVALALEF
jgi:uncharacterized protein (TIGR02001 family)